MPTETFGHGLTEKELLEKRGHPYTDEELLKMGAYDPSSGLRMALFALFVAACLGAIFYILNSANQSGKKQDRLPVSSTQQK